MISRFFGGAAVDAESLLSIIRTISQCFHQISFSLVRWRRAGLEISVVAQFDEVVRHYPIAQ